MTVITKKGQARKYQLLFFANLFLQWRTIWEIFFSKCCFDRRLLFGSCGCSTTSRVPANKLGGCGFESCQVLFFSSSFFSKIARGKTALISNKQLQIKYFKFENSDSKSASKKWLFSHVWKCLFICFCETIPTLLKLNWIKLDKNWNKFWKCQKLEL